MHLPAPQLVHVCDLSVEIAAPVEVGVTALGMRRMIPITGGTVSGPLMQGRILAGGADFQLIVADGAHACLCKTRPCVWHRQKTRRVFAKASR